AVKLAAQFVEGQVSASELRDADLSYPLQQSARMLLDELVTVNDARMIAEAILAMVRPDTKRTARGRKIHDPGAWERARLHEQAGQAELVRDVFGNPFRHVTVNASWLTTYEGRVTKLAKGIYSQRGFDRLPILADALEDAGCDNADLLAHCRGPG